MKVLKITWRSLIALTLVAATANAEWHPPIAEGDELAVWKAVADTIASDNAASPYKLWYYQSDFIGASFIASAVSDPERTEFCGLSSDDVKAMIAELKSANANRVGLPASVAKAAGFKVAYTKDPEARYFAVSRVVFDATKARAWVSVELMGERGSIVHLQKVDGQWSRVSRCGGWYMPRD